MATKEEILAPLNEAQRDAVINYNGKIMLEATAGSGKTATIVARVAYMIKDHVKPSSILVFTFTRKAANELKERIHKAVGPDADKMTISTYHSFCCRILRKFPQYINRSVNFSIYDEEDKEKVLAPICKEHFKSIGSEPLTMNMVKSYIDSFKTLGYSPVEAKAHAADSYSRTCADIYAKYADIMTERNALDFSDMPYLAFRIANAYPEVLDYITNIYQYIISDENQDSNPQNLAFIMLLGSKSNNIMVVGDSDQSIYKFRGSNVANIIAVTNEENFEKKVLGQNYRSTQTIVNASMAVIKHNKTRIPKTTFTENEVGDKIAVVRCPTEAREAEFICQQIESMKNDYNHYSDYAILCRTGRQTRALESALLSHHIPYNVKGVLPFYSRAEIKDLVSYLRFAYNTCDLIALERILSIPKRKIGKMTVKKLLNSFTKTISFDIINYEILAKSVCSTKEGRANLVAFFNVINDIRAKFAEKATISEVLKYIIEAIGYDDYLRAECTDDQTYYDKHANILELVYLSSTYNDIEEFLNNAVLDNQGTDADTSTDRVSVQTIHSSKGLEFPVVFIAGANDNQVPYFRSHNKTEDLEEERRLFYVGMTRAEEALIVTFSQSSIVNGNETRQTMSRFVREIPKEYRSLYSIA